MMNYVSPEFELKAFSCPNCGAYSQQDRHELFKSNSWASRAAFCKICSDPSIWLSNNLNERRVPIETSMIYPDKNNIPACNEDLEDSIKKDYNEAASIVEKSPRWACALLRLAVQKLMIQIWESWKNIDNDIKSLVKKWLNPTIQQALDIVRVTGNNAVHPWEIDLQDNIEVAKSLFGLINLIANDRLTQPRLVQEQYNNLPPSSLDAIKKRDS